MISCAGQESYTIYWPSFKACMDGMTMDQITKGGPWQIGGKALLELYTTHTDVKAVNG